MKTERLLDIKQRAERATPIVLASETVLLVNEILLMRDAEAKLVSAVKQSLSTDRESRWTTLEIRSLRDYFAGQALIANADLKWRDFAELAAASYRAADAMLAERAKTGGGK